MNQAFIDGQNLYMNTKSHGWKIDLARFRVYLREKYNVDAAYYFLGAVYNEQEKLYETIQKAGFILVFREHNQSMIGKKKGNVDTDIVFAIMEKIAEREKFNKVVLVSGDGDYIKVVKYLAKKNKLEKVLAPNRRSMSSLYRPLTPKFVDFLDSSDIKRKIAHQSKRKLNHKK
ncbi:NYN domain-containing protein [Candidatus Saccharibacteria bacterium]|nr:NYN domain-containing protein [Candidatus Saccharibacteria bacterium]